MNMLKSLFFVAALLGFCGSLASEETRIVGEVVDQGCYLRNESHGADHQECAARCLRNGNPAGVLTDEGELYTLASSAPAYEAYAAKRIRVSGTRVDRTIFATSLEIWENEDWVSVPLDKFGAPKKGS